MRSAPAALDLAALAKAVNEGKEYGADRQLIARAEGMLHTVTEQRSAATSRLKALLSAPKAVLSLEELEAAIEAAQLAGVAAAMVDEAAATLERTAAARREGQARLQQLISQPDYSAVDIAALDEAIDSGRSYGVSAEVVVAAAAFRDQVVELRRSCSALLGEMTQQPPRAVDTEGLAAAITKAQAAGVAWEAVDAAQRKLSEVRAARTATRAALEDATAVAVAATSPSAVDVHMLRDVIDSAAHAGVPIEEAEQAEGVYRQVTELREAATSQLASASGLSAESLDLEALDAALASASRVGVSVELLSAAQRKRDEVSATRAAAGSELEVMLNMPTAQIDTVALAAMIATATDAGLPASALQVAERTLVELNARRQAGLCVLTDIQQLPVAHVVIEDLAGAIGEATDAGVGTAAIEAARSFQASVASAREGATTVLQALGRRRLAVRARHRETARRNAAADVQAAFRGHMVRAARRRAQAQKRLADEKSATLLQAALRRMTVVEISREALMASRMLRAGNVFMKFSHNGPPHDRWVWLSDDCTKVQWCEPGKKQKGVLKGAEAAMALTEMSDIHEGLDSALGRHQTSSFFQSHRTFKGHHSGIHKLDRDCCLTVLGSGRSRSLDIQAPNKMVQHDWLVALRLLRALRLEGIEDLKGRRHVRSFIKVREHRRRAEPSFDISGMSRKAATSFANFFRGKARSGSQKLSAEGQERMRERKQVADALTSGGVTLKQTATDDRSAPRIDANVALKPSPAPAVFAQLQSMGASDLKPVESSNDRSAPTIESDVKVAPSARPALADEIRNRSAEIEEKASRGAPNLLHEEPAHEGMTLEQAAAMVQKIWRGRSSRLEVMVRRTLARVPPGLISAACARGLDDMAGLVSNVLGPAAWTRAVYNAPDGWEEGQMVTAICDALSHPTTSQHLWLLTRPTAGERAFLVLYAAHADETAGPPLPPTHDARASGLLERQQSVEGTGQLVGGVELGGEGVLSTMPPLEHAKSFPRCIGSEAPPHSLLAGMKLPGMDGLLGGSEGSHEAMSESDADLMSLSGSEVSDGDHDAVASGEVQSASAAASAQTAASVVLDTTMAEVAAETAAAVVMEAAVEAAAEEALASAAMVLLDEAAQEVASERISERFSERVSERFDEEADVSSDAAVVMSNVGATAAPTAPLEVQAAESAIWYFSDQAQTYGPVSPTQLAAYESSGMLTAECLLWRDGLETWVRLLELPELRAQIKLHAEEMEAVTTTTTTTTETL